MIKNIWKACFIIIIILLIIGTSVEVYAVGNPIDNPNDWKPDQSQTNANNGKFKDAVGKILGAISVVGVLCSVGIAIILGIKYMTSGVEGRAEYKKTLLPYVIGLIMLAMGTALPNIIYTITNNVLTLSN